MKRQRGIRLKLVSEAVATAPVRAIFDEVRHSLGVPHVPILYQAYAAVPDFLTLHWQAFRPAIETRQFFAMGARLAAESYTRAHNYFEVDDLREESGNAQEWVGEGPSLAEVLDYYQYLEPLQLLITVGQMQALAGAIGIASAAVEPATHSAIAAAPLLRADTEASASVQKVWEERGRLLGGTIVPDEHRAMARWPSFYQHYWHSLKGLVQSPLYADGQYRIVESAWSTVRELPLRAEADLSRLQDAGLDNGQVTALADINEWLVGSLSSLLLDMSFARIGCEGGNRRESAAQRTPETAGRTQAA